eukprot:gene3095-3385_t
MSLDKSFELGEITPANIQQLRVLNINTLPVRYSDTFYKNIIETYDKDYMRFAFWNGFVIGGLCSRVEDHPDDASIKRLYIMTINVLAAYRRRGVAAKLLQYVLDTAAKNPAIKEVYLHVQISNNEAKNFYLHHGFEEKEIIPNYYKNIDPADCFLLSKKINQD